MKKGDILIESSGEYSDYSVYGVYIFLEDYEADEKSIVKELLENKIIKEIGYSELWTSSSFRNQRDYTEYRVDKNA